MFLSCRAFLTYIVFGKYHCAPNKQLAALDNLANVTVADIFKNLNCKLLARACRESHGVCFRLFALLIGNSRTKDTLRQ